MIFEELSIFHVILAIVLGSFGGELFRVEIEVVGWWVFLRQFIGGGVIAGAIILVLYGIDTFDNKKPEFILGIAGISGFIDVEWIMNIIKKFSEKWLGVDNE